MNYTKRGESWLASGWSQKTTGESRAAAAAAATTMGLSLSLSLEFRITKLIDLSKLHGLCCSRSAAESSTDFPAFAQQRRKERKSVGHVTLSTQPPLSLLTSQRSMLIHCPSSRSPAASTLSLRLAFFSTSGRSSCLLL